MVAPDDATALTAWREPARHGSMLRSGASLNLPCINTYVSVAMSKLFLGVRVSVKLRPKLLNVCAWTYVCELHYRTQYVCNQFCCTELD